MSNWQLIVSLRLTALAIAVLTGFGVSRLASQAAPAPAQATLQGLR